MRIGKLDIAGALARLRPHRGTTKAGDDPVFQTYEAAARAALRNGTTVVPSTLRDPRNARRQSPAIASSNSLIAPPTANIAELRLPRAVPIDETEEVVTRDGRRTQPAPTAPDSLLRTPDSVAPVADDFFDSVIRRVEGSH